jgi:hypothetical protein
LCESFRLLSHTCFNITCIRRGRCTYRYYRETTNTRKRKRPVKELQIVNPKQQERAERAAKRRREQLQSEDIGVRIEEPSERIEVQAYHRNHQHIGSWTFNPTMENIRGLPHARMSMLKFTTDHFLRRDEWIANGGRIMQIHDIFSGPSTVFLAS